MQGVNAAKILAVICVLSLLLSFGFRALIYSRIPIVQGEPYGFADLIVFLLGCVTLFALFASVSLAAVLAIQGPRHNRLAAIWLGLVVFVVYLLVGPLLTLAVRWASA